MSPGALSPRSFFPLRIYKNKKLDFWEGEALSGRLRLETLTTFLYLCCLTWGHKYPGPPPFRSSLFSFPLPLVSFPSSSALLHDLSTTKTFQEQYTNGEPRQRLPNASRQTPLPKKRKQDRQDALRASLLQVRERDRHLDELPRLRPRGVPHLRLNNLSSPLLSSPLPLPFSLRNDEEKSRPTKRK